MEDKEKLEFEIYRHLYKRLTQVEHFDSTRRPHLYDYMKARIFDAEKSIAALNIDRGNIDAIISNTKIHQSDPIVE